ncbi:MAG: polyprenyl synthetase family protein [Terriglobia bacterium]
MPPTETDPNGNGAVWELPSRLGLTPEIQQLREFILRWVEECDPEVREIVRHQVSGRAKYFRPVTIFACYRATTGKPVPATLLPAVAALELTHNVTLIIDDILDRSRFRRGNLSLHCRFGFLPALMTAGYISSAGSKMVASDPYNTRLLAELLQRLGVAECLQWRLRRQPLGVEDWRTIAAEDTGSMFEICARLGTRDNRLQKFGQLLGMLYHGCDDVADVRGTTALGGGSAKDIEDGILTLPAAMAIRDPETAILFRHPSPKNIKTITAKLVAALPEAEEYLDLIASEAESEAMANASFPEQLIALVRDTRMLSQS